jgi:hypothetical protein
MPVWEDATVDGLVEVVPGDVIGIRGSRVRLTALGEIAIARHAGSRSSAP